MQFNTSLMLDPSVLYGDINLKGGYLGIATGRGDRSIKRMAKDDIIESDPNLFDPWLPDAKEGSIARWEGLENGTYAVTGYLVSRERTLSQDSFGYWQDDVYHELLTRADATQRVRRNLYQSQEQTFEIEVTDGKLTLLTLDTGDKGGTTEFRLTGLEFLDDRIIPTAEDGIGDWDVMGDRTIFTTDGVSALTLEQDFFRSEVTDYGSQGSGVLLVTDPGLNQITFEVDTAIAGEDQLLVWDGEKFLKATDSLESGTYTIDVDMMSDEWGFAVLDRGTANGNTEIEITDVRFDEAYRTNAIADTLAPPELDLLTGQTDLGYLWPGEPTTVNDEFVGAGGDEFTFITRDWFELTFEMETGAIAYEVYDDWSLVGSGTVSGDPVTDIISGYGENYRLEITALSNNSTVLGDGQAIYDMSLFT